MIALLKGLNDVFTHPLNQGRVVSTLGRILFWKLNQRFVKLPIIRTFAGGFSCICYPDSSYGGLVMYTGYPEYEILKFLEKKITDKDTFIDVGANIGLVSLIAASRNKQSVYSFEADPQVFPRLQENIRLNNWQHRIVAINQAVSDKKGQVQFAVEKHSEVSHLKYTKTPTSKHTTTKVQATSLDVFVAQQRLSGTLVVKIDVEGAELLVLKGMKKLLTKHQVRLITFEVNRNCQQYGYQPSELLSYLQSFGYRITDPHTGQIVNTLSPDIFNHQVAFNLIATARNTK